GAPKHERYVIAMPLALSRTQDDKGRVRWTLFGASERPLADPGKKFWQRLAREVYGDAPYEITFTPFADLPARTRDAYVAGDLCLLPFPGSLLFLHSPSYRKLAQQLPGAMQIPLLYSIARSESPHGIRVTQSGWMHEAEDPGEHGHGPVMNTMKRTNRWTRVHRHEDELPVLTLHQKTTHTLFSTEAEDLGLYGKPMARNSQIWTGEYELLLDGPGAGREELMRAAREVDEGGVFGYRFFYPPMRIGSYEVYWHRPVVAWDGGFLEDAPLGRVIAGDVELEPIILQRPEHLAAVHDPETRKILDATELLGKLEESLAACLLHAKRGEGGQRPDEGREFEARTFRRTATRKYETRYWRTIAKLAHGSYINKDNADVVLDDATQKRLKHRRNDLDRLADHLVGYYEKLGVTTGWQPFEWETDFDYPWSGGWRAGGARNIITIIPGRNRKKAVIMADHYDTAYMEDKFGHTGKGPRLAAPGADDNHSATAALMLAAPIFLEQKLEHDIWLVHLTGEEFPADCLGARNLTQAIVERTLRLHRTRGKPLDLSKTEIAGVFVLDMVAHNNRRERDIFQICPGWGRSSMLLAREAHRANMDWNAHAAAMNERGARR
ncbi:MAG: M28 family peptidase, partial [Thermoanaerobaculia bacterium]